MDPDEILDQLARSPFRRKFRLQGKELAYLQTWGIDHVMRQARDILTRRVAAAAPANDGRQTPWRNHPVFVAQHATASCCRGCIEKNHAVARGHALAPSELDQLLSVIERWLAKELERAER